MHSDLTALALELQSGRFVRPDWSKPNPVALARAISDFGGYSRWDDDPLVSEIGQRIGDPDHTVVVIADGFGMNFVRNLPSNSFSQTHLAWEQPSVFPSSTGPNMTTLYSGEYPAAHGFVGWWVYLPQIGEPATVYEWVKKVDRTSLTTLGLDPKDVFLCEPYAGKVNVDCTLLMPSALKNSIPTLHSESGGAPVEGYNDLSKAFEVAVQRVRTASTKTLTLIYWNQIDHLAHGLGVSADETTDSVRELDAALDELASELRGKARIVVTADHGHLDIPQYVHLDPAHPLTKLTKCGYSGDDRVSYFHVGDGQQQRFADEFRSEFSEHFLLLSTDELIESRLLGPEPPTPAVRERLGDFTSISRRGAGFTWRAPDNRADAHRSTHGGLSMDEMMVPVLLA